MCQAPAFFHESQLFEDLSDRLILAGSYIFTVIIADKL
jgi:hypothetical protein